MLSLPARPGYSLTLRAWGGTGRRSRMGRVSRTSAPVRVEPTWRLVARKRMAARPTSALPAAAADHPQARRGIRSRRRTTAARMKSVPVSSARPSSAPAASSSQGPAVSEFRSSAPANTSVPASSAPSSAAGVARIHRIELASWARDERAVCRLLRALSYAPTGARLRVLVASFRSSRPASQSASSDRRIRALGKDVSAGRDLVGIARQVGNDWLRGTDGARRIFGERDHAGVSPQPIVLPETALQRRAGTQQDLERLLHLHASHYPGDRPQDASLFAGRDGTRIGRLTEQAAQARAAREHGGHLAAPLEHGPVHQRPA